MAKPLKALYPLTSPVQDAPGAITPHVFRTATVDLSCRLPVSELAKLYRMIEMALPGNNHRIVQFTSAYRDEGSSEIALETAILAARLIGQRVLFIDTSTAIANKSRKQFPNTLHTSMDALLLMGASPYEAIAKALGTELYFAKLSERGNDGLAPIPLNAIESALQSMRLNFDLIIIDSQGLMNDAFSMVLAKLADGSVMVIEAERTRAPVATECKRLIEKSGGRLIGAVMNKRQLYIPEALYRVLY